MVGVTSDLLPPHLYPRLPCSCRVSCRVNLDALRWVTLRFPFSCATLRSANMRRFSSAAVIFFLASTLLHGAQSDPPLLLRFPTVNKTHIVFNYAGDLWIVARDGGEAHR